MDSAHAVIGGYEERIVATADGLALYVRDYPPLAPQTGAPVICLHGLTRNSRDFEIVAPRIAALGRRVVAPDMRGRGRSANDPDPAHYVPPVYAQDVLRILDELAVPKAVFVGTSMGGIITMIIGATAPDRIEAAALNDIGAKLGEEGIARIQVYVGRARPVSNWAEAGEAVKASNLIAFPDRADDSAFWEMMARRTWREREDGKIEVDYDPTIALAFAGPDTAPTLDITPLFQPLTAKPVLIVRGALSDILPPEAITHMRALKPDLAVAEVSRIGHAPNLDEPEAWDALLGFLARVG